jgi:hypothetical protein
MSDDKSVSNGQSQGKDTDNVIIKPIFDGDDDENVVSFANEFRDKVQVLFEYFDKDVDGYLNYAELRKLQSATSGVVLSEEMYIMACKALNCHPSQGLSLDALKFTYASDGADIETDCNKVFGTKDETSTTKEDGKKKNIDDDIIYEAGTDGFDIS